MIWVSPYSLIFFICILSFNSFEFMLLMCNKNLIVSNSIFVHWLKKKPPTNQKKKNKQQRKTHQTTTQPLETNTLVSEEYQAAICCFFNRITEDIISVSYFEELSHLIKQYCRILFILFNGHLFVLISSWHNFYFYILWEKKCILFFEYLYELSILDLNVEVYIQYFHSWC